MAAGLPLGALDGLPPLPPASFSGATVSRPTSGSVSHATVGRAGSATVSLPSSSVPELIGVDENNLRQLLNEHTQKIQGVTEGWKFNFSVTPVDADLLRQLLTCQRRSDYFRAMTQLFRHADEEVAKLRLVFQLFDEKIKEAAAETTLLQTEVAALREFRNDFLNNRKSFLTKISDKMAGQQELSAVDRMALQRSLVEAQRLCNEATSQRADLQVQLATLEMLNKRLENKLRVANNRLKEAGITATGQDADIYIPPTPDYDGSVAAVAADDAQPPSARVGNKFAPPGTALNPLPSQPVTEAVPSPEPPPPLVTVNVDGIDSTLASLSPPKPEDGADVAQLRNVCRQLELSCGSQHMQPAADYYELCAALGTNARNLLHQAKLMAGTVERDWRSFGRTANCIVRCLLSVANSSPSAFVPAAELGQLFAHALHFATAVAAFVLLCQNRSVVFEEPPPDADFRHALVALIKHCGEIKARQINFVIAS